LKPENFAESVERMADMGVKMVGGCCGTNPDFIKALRTRLGNRKYRKRDNPKRTAAASARQTVFFDRGFRVIGQRINPSGRKDLADSIRNGDLDPLYEEAVLQKQAGAEILDINVHTENSEERDIMAKAVEYIQSMIPIPLQLDSSDYSVLEAGARVYNGKPIINSVNGTRISMEHVFPVVRKYGGCVIGLSLDENGISPKAEGRLEVARKIVGTARTYGIPKEDILIDCLVQSAARGAKAAKETLKAVSLIKRELGVKTVLGISNISYGRRERSVLNAVYLAMAMGAGLDCAIVDPTAKEIAEVVGVYNMLSSTE